MRDRVTGQEPTYVFVYGFLGFDRIGPASLGIAYFRHLADAFVGLRLRWLVADGMPAGGTVVARAQALRRFLDRHDARNVVLIAHSMGGLDCRHLIHALDDRRRVSCLITLGTPHRGAPLASRALTGDGLLWPLVRALGKDGLRDLTPESCAERNQIIGDRADVRYLSVAGMRPVAEQAWLFRALLPDVMAAEGPHDGFVSVASAAWGDLVTTVRADHFELVGWDPSLSGLPFVRRLGRGRPAFDHVGLLRRLIDMTRQATETDRC